MAIRTIRTDGDPVLRKISKPVKEITPKIVTLVDDMLDTMYEAMGVGLAAPQVTYIMHALSEKGMHVNTEVTTIEEAVDEIMKEI